jgi:hypothetical protein
VPCGEIDLATVTAVAAVPGADRRYCFNVDAVNKKGKVVSYPIQAAGDAEVSAWVDIIDWARVRACFCVGGCNGPSPMPYAQKRTQPTVAARKVMDDAAAASAGPPS